MNSKIAISVVIWLISLPLLGLQLIFTMGVMVEGSKQLFTISLQTPGTIEGLATLCSLILGLLSWVALFVMTIGWIKNIPVSLRWPLSGTIFAILGLISVSTFFVIIAFPEIIFASFLCVWHVRNRKSSSEIAKPFIREELRKSSTTSR